MKNPQAFPSYEIEYEDYFDGRTQERYEEPTEGMTLLDWFAGKSLTGIKSNKELCHICSKIEGLTQQEAIAKMAYSDAESMLKEREKRNV